MKRIFLGHHKCGSSWLKVVFQAICDQAGLPYKDCWLGDVLPLNWHFRRPWAARIAAQRNEFLDPTSPAVSHVNAYPVLIADLGDTPYRAFHVIRDPRDILVSGYYSHIKTHPVGPDFNPWKMAHRERLQKAKNLEDGMLLEMSYSDHYLRRIDAIWQVTSRNPNVLALHLEDIAADPAAGFERIVRHFGFWDAKGLNNAIDEKFVDGLVEKFSFQNMKSENTGHYRDHERKGWKTHFTPKISHAFELLHPGLLERQSYEENT